jgi:hexosaminidase
MLPIAQKAVENGVNVVLSNCQTTYLEEMYSLNKQEIGNGWAGAIDIKTAFSLDPFNPEYPYTDNSRILGVQTQLWSTYIDHFVFPKGLGNFDRAWNAAPRCDYNHYYSTLINNELPHLQRCGVAFHIPQPGLKIEDGKLIANAPYKGGEIRYTLDEQTPTAKSALWSAPIEISDDVKVVSARYFYDGRESVTTTLRR